MGNKSTKGRLADLQAMLTAAGGVNGHQERAQAIQAEIERLQGVLAKRK